MRYAISKHWCNGDRQGYEYPERNQVIRVADFPFKYLQSSLTWSVVEDRAFLKSGNEKNRADWFMS